MKKNLFWTFYGYAKTSPLWWWSNLAFAVLFQGELLSKEKKYLLWNLAHYCIIKPAAPLFVLHFKTFQSSTTVTEHKSRSVHFDGGSCQDASLHVVTVICLFSTWQDLALKNLELLLCHLTEQNFAQFAKHREKCCE